MARYTSIARILSDMGEDWILQDEEEFSNFLEFVATAPASIPIRTIFQWWYRGVPDEGKILRTWDDVEHSSIVIYPFQG